MSSPIYELLKRPDELFVVEHAHLTPRFVEDSVRLMVKSALDAYGELADDDFVLARQVNFETIHNHEVLAERFGTVGELRAELAERRPHRRPAPSSATGSRGVALEHTLTWAATAPRLRSASVGCAILCSSPARAAGCSCGGAGRPRPRPRP